MNLNETEISVIHMLVILNSGAVMQAVCRISDGLLLTPRQGRALPAITYPQSIITRNSSAKSYTSNNPSQAPEVCKAERQSSVRSTLSSAEVIATILCRAHPVLVFCTSFPGLVFHVSAYFHKELGHLLTSYIRNTYQSWDI